MPLIELISTTFFLMAYAPLFVERALPGLHEYLKK
jgi:hypothetical protein